MRRREKGSGREVCLREVPECGAAAANQGKRKRRVFSLLLPKAQQNLRSGRSQSERQREKDEGEREREEKNWKYK